MTILRMTVLAACVAGAANAYAQDSDCSITLLAGSVYGQSEHTTSSNINPAYSSITPTFGIDGNGAGGGFGCRWRSGPWVGGFEADYMKTSTKGSAQDFIGAEARTEIENAGTLRLTGGFMLRPKLLFYLTGGMSTGSVKATVCPAPTSCFSEPHRLYGGVFGGGFDYAFTRQLSARVEWLWYGLENKVYFSPAPAAGVAPRTGVSPDFQTIRAGLSWHF